MKRPFIKVIFLQIITISIIQHFVFAQSVELTVDEIMQGQDFTGHWPEDFYWSENGKQIFFEWNPEGKAYSEWFSVDISSSEINKLDVAQYQQMTMGKGTFNNDHSLKVYERFGDLFLLNVKDNETTQLTYTSDREINPSFSSDEKYILFQRGYNAYSWNIETGQFRQWSNFKNGKPQSEQKADKRDAWLEQDQLKLFDVLKERKANNENSKAYRDSLALKRPKEIFSKGGNFRNIKMSPDMKFITFTISNVRNSKRTASMEFVNESGYAKILNAREKVGAQERSESFYIYQIENDTVIKFDHEALEGIFQKPAFLKEYAKSEFEAHYEKARNVVFHAPTYSSDGKAAMVIKSSDNKSRWIVLLNLETGEHTLLDKQRDEAWIGGPGISSWNFSSGNLGWLPDNEHVWFQSEETGYSHLYTVDIATGKKTVLTKGDFEILDAELAQDGKTFYITSNKEHPGEHHFYTLDIKRKQLKQITEKPGKYNVKVSPDGDRLAFLYSSANQPWELYTMPLKESAEMKKLTDSQSERFKVYDWRVPKVVTFKADDGAKVYARLYKPEKVTNNQPAVIFVHGAGYLQNAHKWWSSYYREYMFHNMLVDKGYIVLDIDYRGSAGYGRDWRTGIYRHMGGKDLSDQIDGAKYLVDEHGVSEDKIGIYGGSYGGFITLMALFKNPGVFQSGAALRSVTDWAHYNHPYTANILNTPVQDSIAYQRSSPIYFAENLQDKLLMLHGMVDLNVQFQDIVRLSQRLIELEKENWELAVFPVEGHGFVEPSSWKDEYKRIFKLFEETLK